MKITDTDQRRVFLRLAREEQVGTLYDMLSYVRAELAKDVNEHIALRADITFIKGELQGIGRRGNDETLSTTAKFDAEFEKRSRVWVWYRDKVLSPTLSQMHSLIILAILALTFGKALNLLP